MIFRRTLLFLLLTIIFAACGGAPERTGDAAPLPQELPSQAAPEAAQPATAAATGALPAAETQNSQTALTFSINGGIAGFCDELTLTASGDYFLNNCQRGQTSGTLPQSDRVSLKTWYENLAGFQLHTEDNPDGADNLSTTLEFMGVGATEADDSQKQVVFDWVSGLVVQLRPKPAADTAPTPDSGAVNANGLCPDLGRPALLLTDFETPTNITLLNVASQATCDVTLSRSPFGRILSAAGSLYYPVANQEEKTVTLWQVTPSGEQLPLEFTAISMEEPAPHGFIVSDDGTKVAWAQTIINLETEPPIYKNYLWLADANGANQITILDGVENEELRYVLPLRFSSSDNTLFYVLQPDLGGPALGRFDNLYRVPVAGGDPAEVYTCNAEDNPLCLTGLAQDGSVFTVLNPATDSMQVVRADGAVINEIPLPATDYVERTAFNQAGDLAFVSATLTEPASEEDIPLPNPGYLTMLKVPYTGEPQNIVSDNSVGTLWGWLDNQRLVYGTINEAGETSTAVVDLAGESNTVSAKFAIGVLH